MKRKTSILVVLLAGMTAAGAWGTSAAARQAPPSDRPETPFKLATFEAAGQVRVGLVLGTRVLELGAANQHVTTAAKLPAMPLPAEMRALIEQYASVSGRLYQIANYFAANPPAKLPFVFDAGAVSFKAPIKDP